MVTDISPIRGHSVTVNIIRPNHMITRLDYSQIEATRSAK
jgi:hypothetical protein